MTTRISLPPDDEKKWTRCLLRDILIHSQNGERVMFVVGPGQGRNIIQACRVMLSRVRTDLKNQGRKRKHFNLHSTVHPHTEDGKRFDCVVVWQSQSLRHSMSESFEDLLVQENAL